MVKVEFIKNFANKKKGDVVEFEGMLAAQLISEKAAKKVTKKAAKKDK